MECFSALNEAMSFVEKYILSKIIQTEKDKYIMFSHMRNVQLKDKKRMTQF
jgi:hypothetical protein